MAQAKDNRGTIVILGAAAVAVVAVLLAVFYWAWSGKLGTPQSSVPAQQSSAQPPEDSARIASKDAVPGEAAAKNPAPAKAPAEASAESPIVPSFDLVRVEPNGDSVIAGRAAPGATIELLRGDHVHARAVADASGLFAITPPPLPPGSHHIALQSIAPNGVRQRSQQSVAVVINDGQTRPLVALTAPDKPTVLLSNPEPPVAKAPEPAAPSPTPETAQAKPAEEPAQPAPTQQANAEPPQSDAPAQPAPPAQPASRPDIKIVSVESEDGKLFVSGLSAPGATIRLYLNESLIAPGGAGGDGKVSFSIGRGVKPGDYRVRLDDVDPVSGQVKSRAEVAFNVPEHVVTAEDQAPAEPARALQAPAAAPPQIRGKVASAIGGGPIVAPEGQGTEQVVQQTAEEAQLAAAGTVVIPSINTAIVSRGDNLWRISQRIYGKGVRYTVIYGANQDQIRNPDLIYPGQVFVLPSQEEQKTN